MAVIKIKNWYIITGILISALIVMTIVTFSFYSKVVSLSKNLNEIKSDKDKLLLEKGSLQNELNSKSQLVKSKDSDFTDYKDGLKKYVSTQKVIIEDVQAIIETIREYDALVIASNDYNKLKLVVDKYESQLNTMKDHIQQYEDIINKYNVILAELGIETVGEIDKLEKSLPLYNKILTQMRDYISTLK